MIYPDETWLAVFERRLAAGQLLAAGDAQALITALRQARQERDDLAAALAPLGVQLEQHHHTPQPDEWYERAAGVDGGPVAGRAAARPAAVHHHCDHYHELRAEGEALAAEVVHLQARVAELRAQRDQADSGPGLEIWRQALGE